MIRFYFLKFSWIVHRIHPLLQLLHLWSDPLYCLMTFSQFLYSEFVNSQFLTSLQFSHFVNTSDLSVSKCFLFHDQFFLHSNLLSSRFCISEKGVLQFQPLSISLLLEFTDASVKRFHFVLLLHEFRSCFSKQVNSVSIKKRFRNICPERESEEGFIAPENLLMSKGKILSVGKRFLIQPILAWKQRDKFPCTCRILRWTGHQVFSFTVINLRTFSTCFSHL